MNGTTDARAIQTASPCTKCGEGGHAMTDLAMLRFSFACGIGMLILGIAILVMFKDDQKVVCECGWSSWLEAEECKTCLACGRVRTG